MFNSKPNKLTNMARFFLEPSNPAHRQYEALRAYFVDDLPSVQVARRFGDSPGSFRVLAHQFRQNPDRPFFLPPQKGPQASPKTDRLRDKVVALRKQNLSIYDISRVLEGSGQRVSAVAISLVLKEEGFARLPRRRDEERLPGPRPEVAEVADVNRLDLSARRFRTQFGGLYLFVPYLAQIPLERLLEEAGLPGAKMIPAAAALLSLLGLKLFGSARHSHVMSYVLDEAPPRLPGASVLVREAVSFCGTSGGGCGSYPRLMR